MNSAIRAEVVQIINESATAPHMLKGCSVASRATPDCCTSKVNICS